MISELTVWAFESHVVALKRAIHVCDENKAINEAKIVIDALELMLEELECSDNADYRNRGTK